MSSSNNKKENDFQFTHKDYYSILLMFSFNNTKKYFLLNYRHYYRHHDNFNELLIFL